MGIDPENNDFDVHKAINEIMYNLEIRNPLSNIPLVISYSKDKNTLCQL